MEAAGCFSIVLEKIPADLAARVAKEVNIPVLVIHDKQDEDVPVNCAEHIYKHLPNGRIFITDGLGHRKILGDKTTIQHILAFTASEI